MSLPVIGKLRALIAGGAVVIGPKPLGAAGLGDSNERVVAMASEIWGRKPGVTARKFGRGRIYPALSIEDAMNAERVLPDVTVAGEHGLCWAHRSTPDAEIYFLSNQADRPFEGPVVFRVHGKHAELWHAADGSRSPVDHTVGGQTTTVRVDLPPYASRFIVFRGQASPGNFTVAPRQRHVLTVLDGPWNVEFLDGQGTPQHARLAASASWTDNTDPSIRYYSGRAKYLRTIAIDAASLAPGRRIELDLGAVGEMASVRINDRDLGVWWTEPLRRDITDVLRAGENQLEIVVTNYWANRIIGDEQPGAARITFAPIQPYTAASPLLASGLLGPVRLLESAASEKETP
jgi:hypothetical protein